MGHVRQRDASCFLPNFSHVFCNFYLTNPFSSANISLAREGLPRAELNKKYPAYLFNINGGIAQLGERLNGIQEVSGSIPLISTTDGALGILLIYSLSQG